MAKRRVRKPLTPTQRRRVARKTGHRCHVCGGKLDGDWHADHVRPLYLEGECREDNFLPSCVHCNRMRWGYDPRRIKKILRMGVYMLDEVERRTTLGKAIERRYKSRLRTTKSRRM